MKKISFLIFILLITFSSFSQIEVSCKLRNVSTDQPIEFASVLIQETFDGTISDTSGVFNIEVENSNQYLIFQSIGFKTDTMQVKDILKTQTIYLQVENYELSQVTVYPRNAFEIIRKAIKKIPENYHSDIAAQNIYYRQEIVTNNQLLSLEEANFDALLKYKNKNVNIVSVNKSRALLDLDTLKSLGKMVEKGLEDFDSVDIKENVSSFFHLNYMLSEIGSNSKTLFGDKGFKNYKYNYNGLVQIDTFFAYHITFDQLDGIRKSLYKGHFYIDTASLAFIDFQIYNSPKGLKYQKIIPKHIRLIAKMLGYSIYVKSVRYNVNYKKIGTKWLMNTVGTTFSAKVSKKNAGSFDGHLKTFFKVNNNFSKENFYNRTSKYNKIGSDISDFFDNNFWGSNKYVPLSKHHKKLLLKNKNKNL